MALQTKSIVGDGSKGHHRFTLTITENSTNISDNTSSVSFSFVLSPMGTWDWVYENTVPVTYSIDINGAKYSGNIMRFDGKSALTVRTETLSIKHNDDGSKKINFSFSVSSLDVYYLPGSASASGSMDLTYIPRASTISCTEADIESNPTITISRASSSFTHTITYKFGALSGMIAEKTSATSITSWTIPAEFYAQIPDAKRGYGTLTCTTYNGTTAIGTSQCEFWVSTNKAKCEPTVSGTVAIDSRTNTLTGRTDTLIRYFSTATCTISTTLNKNAGSIKVQTINNTAVSAVSGATLAIPNVGTGVFEFYAQDSREYFNSDKQVRNLIPYVMLTADVTAWRVEPTDNSAKLKIEGNYYKGSFGAQNNTLTVMYRPKGASEYSYATPTISDDNTYTVTVDLPNLDYTKAFEYEVVVEDMVSAVPKPATIQKGIPVFDWGEEDFNFNVPVTINGVNILEKLAELERLVKG